VVGTLATVSFTQPLCLSTCSPSRVIGLLFCLRSPSHLLLQIFWCVTGIDLLDLALRIKLLHPAEEI
jgi:hypothetical protein